MEGFSYWPKPSPLSLSLIILRVAAGIRSSPQPLYPKIKISLNIQTIYLQSPMNYSLRLSLERFWKEGS